MEHLNDSGAPDGDGLDPGLMAFAARRRRQREERDIELDPAKSSGSPDQDDDTIEFVEVVSSSSAPNPRKLEPAIVEEVIPGAPKKLGEIPPSATGAEMPSEADSYAVKRVQELRIIARATPTFQPTEETSKAAEEAQKMNLEALEEGKPKGRSAAKAGTKTAAAKATSKQTQ